MPKVLRIINRFNLGGPTYNAAYLTKHMAPEFETMLVGGYKDESEEKSEYIVRNLGIEPVIIPEMRREINPAKDLVAYRKLKKIIEDFKPDIVHTHASKAGTLGRTAAFLNKVPVIIHTFHGHVFHSYFKSYKASTFKRIEKGLSRISSQIIAISDLQKHELANVYKIAKPEKIKVIPLGFDLDKFSDNTDIKRKQFRSQYQIGDDEIAITIVGRLVPIKNHHLFLDGLNYVLKNTNRKVRAFIVGDGETRAELEEKATKLGIKYSDTLTGFEKAPLTFTSWIKDVDYVYSGSDIVALSSLNEGTPVSLIEAQASGKAIVTTNAGGIENTVNPGKTALVSATDDVMQFCKNMLELVENDKLRESLQNDGKKYVCDRFHYSRLINDMKNLYYELLP